LCPGETDFEINNYFQWFNIGVTHWLDISVYKALSRIQKAIDLDTLVPVDEAVKYSSSAVDTLAIFYQIKIFWKQLDWPQAEGAYIFVSKIVDDICRCCVFYADRMSQKVENLGKVENIYEKKFEVTQEWCLAINNIDYIRQSIQPFVKELGVDQIILNMSECLGEMEAQRCSDTLENVIKNAIDTENNKILELIENVSEKMNPPMKRFLTEGAELLHTDSNSMDRLMMYLENSLSTLHLELNEDNFDRILDAIWQQLASILYHLVNTSLEKRRPPSFFANLRGALNMLVTNFKSHNNNTTSDKETLEKVQRLLELHGYETSDLIQQYYLDRYIEQKSSTDTPLGILTVQCYFKANQLEIEILNAKNLVPLDTNGLCDPFVRVHFLPEEKFLSVVKPKTQTHSKTLFPLFDEKFSM
jgi:BAI1-associated protein 3